MNENIENGDVVEMDEVHYGKRCYYPVIEYHPNTGSIAYEKEQLTKATYSVLIHDSNVSRVFIEKGKHFQLMRKIIESNNEIIKEKEQKIALFQSRITLEYANYLKWLETHPTCSKEQREHINQCMDLLRRISERQEDKS